MKTLCFSLVAIFLWPLTPSFSQCNGCTTTWNGSDNSINVTTGTYCFNSGTFTGTISGLSAGATICVGPNAVFNPSSLGGSQLLGTMNLYGECTLPDIVLGANFSMNAYKKVTFTGNFSINGDHIAVTNSPQSCMIFTRGFQLERQGSFINMGFMKMSGHFNTTSGTTVTNKGDIRMEGDFNPAGTFTNDGLVLTKEKININSNSTVINNCRFLSVKGFINNAYFKNNGLIWVTSADNGESHIQNNGGATIELGPQSTIRGIRFSNDGLVKGAGKCYFTGHTLNQGTFAGTSAGATINFYDVSQTGSQFFDQQNTTPTNTIRTAFVPQDTTTFGSCTDANFQIINKPVTTLYVKVLLQGPYVAATTLMHDSLRSKTFIPTTQPYLNTLSARFKQVGGGTETAVASFLHANAGANSIVDWVMIELRSAVKADSVVRTISGLLQRDGDVVAADGTAIQVTLSDGQYYVAVKHRNHLGVMTASASVVAGTENMVNFITLTPAQVYGSNARYALGSGKYALWAGDVNSDGKVKYQGPLNDANVIVNDVQLASGNPSGLFNYDSMLGYFRSDVDMNGKAKYQGGLNDANIILNNLQLFPGNPTGLFNYNLMTEQIP